MERLGLGNFEIAESLDGSLVALELSGPAAEALSSGDGRPVDALQLLANQVAARSEEPQRVVLDIAGPPRTGLWAGTGGGKRAE